jgi:integrase
MLKLGLRPSEALALRWEHLELGEAPSLRVAESKTDSGRRTLPLPPKVAAALRAHKRRQGAERLAATYWHDPGLVFSSDIGAAIDYRRMSDWWGRVVARSGLEHRRLYSTRHTALTLMLNNEVALEVVSEIAGHASLSITADVYAHVGDGLKRGALDVIDDILG